MLKDTVINSEDEFARLLDELMRQGRYPEMRSLALQYTDSYGRSPHAATHAVLCNVWRELNDRDKLIQHLALGDACTDVTKDLQANMRREAMIYNDKHKNYRFADRLWSVIEKLRRDPSQAIVDMIARAKGLYYRDNQFAQASTMIDGAAHLLRSGTQEIIAQDVLNCAWWGLQIYTMSNRPDDAEQCAEIIVHGTTVQGEKIPPDQKKIRVKLAGLMLRLHRRPRVVFKPIRSGIIRLMRSYDMSR